MPVETIQSGKKVVGASGKAPVYHSTFPMGAPVGGTYRFGEYGVIKAWNIEKGDAWKLMLPHELESPMLKAPLQQGMNIKKDLFFVPRQAMLPNSWDKLEIYPVKGDDAPDDAGAMVLNFGLKLKTQFDHWVNQMYTDRANLINNDGTDNGFTDTFVKFLIMAEMFYSRGCLMAALGHPMGSYWSNPVGIIGGNPKELKHNFDYYFDTMITKCLETGDYWLITSGGTQIKVVLENPEETEISLRNALFKLRDEPTLQISPGGRTDLSWFLNNDWRPTISAGGALDKPFSYYRLLAYQICCAHYFTNDKIDYIYNAELYRQLMGAYAENAYGFATYNYNGIKTQYDWLSGKFLDIFINQNTIDWFVNQDPDQYSYLRNIFQYNRSLRFKDYFTGARSQPLAVGNYDVAVNNNAVSVLNITKGLLSQKLGNAVNRVGSRIESQSKELMNVEMAYDYHNPMWLGHLKDSFGAGQETSVGDALLNAGNLPNGMKVPIVSQFESNSGSNVFTCHFDRRGIMIAIQYFDIPRMFVDAVDKFWYHENKFDEFNTYMQFTGDQEIKLAELMAKADMGSIFAYTGKFMEYKLELPRAWGGYVHDLPGWMFLADDSRNEQMLESISPSYIRSYPTDIDMLFQSLTGYSYGTYWHFICKTDIIAVAKRRMAYNPGILNN